MKRTWADWGLERKSSISAWVSLPPKETLHSPRCMMHMHVYIHKQISHTEVNSFIYHVWLVREAEGNFALMKVHILLLCSYQLEADDLCNILNQLQKTHEISPQAF